MARHRQHQIMVNLFPDRSPNSPQERRPYGPTNYQSRPVKLRLFAMVALLMLVLAVAERARDPKSWAWFEMLSRQETPDSSGVDTLLRKTEATEQDKQINFTSEDSSTQPAPPESDVATEYSPEKQISKAWELGWREVYQSLDADQKTLLFDLLGSGFGRAALSGDDIPAAEKLIVTLTERWEAYSVKAFQSLAAIDETDRNQWVEILRAVNGRQKDKLHPALHKLTTAARPTADELSEISAFQALVDSFALKKVADDTVMRPADHQLLYRYLAEPLPVSKDAQSSITFLELVKQPDAFRGKPITIRGRVKEVSRQVASKNRNGISDIYMYWLMLEDGPTSPIQVMSALPPEGFPKILQPDGKTRQRMQEDIVFQGYFLKRFAYQAKDGDRVTPLILTHQPTWIQTKTLREQREDEPFINDVMFSVPVVVVLSFTIVAVVYFLAFHKRKQPALTPPSAELLHALEQLPVPPTTSESLKQLENQASSNSKPDSPTQEP
ncbi:MAG: hypothetical protein ACO1RA_19715 [Planctomycetaceae bacterium]